MKLSKEASVGGLLLFGTTTSSFAKLVYELKSVGLHGESKNFRKPWAMTAIMFLGMSMCLPFAYQPDEKQEVSVLGTSLSTARSPSEELMRSLVIAVPAGFDLVATVLMNVGLLSVTASVYQMLRGACMLFAAVFAVTFLKRSLNGLHFTGIGCAIAGIALVGLSSLLASGDGVGAAADMADSSTVLMGMALIVLSQAAQAAQITCEDYLMRTRGVSPLQIVGWEGVYGLVAMALLMLPAAHLMPGLEGQGIHEDFFDTIAMVAGSPTLQTVLAVDMAAFLAYNVAGMSVTEHYGGVYRSVLETLRTLFVWLVSLGLYYGMHGQMGEPWTAYSHLQAAGFAVLVAGTMLYGRGNSRRLEEEQQQMQEQQPEMEEQEPMLQETLAVASAAAGGIHLTVNPGMTRSPSPLPAYQHPASQLDTHTTSAHQQEVPAAAAARSHVRTHAVGVQRHASQRACTLRPPRPSMLHRGSQRAWCAASARAFC